MKVIWVFLFLFCFVIPFCEARILNPEEAKALLNMLVERSMDKDYWSVWRFRDEVTGEERFVEVLFLRNMGFAWKELGEENVVNMRLGNCRYIVNLKSGEVESIYPILDFPFAPLEKETFPLVLENYLFDLQDQELVLFAKRTGEAVRSFLLSEEGGIVGQRVYASQGKVLKEWRLIYRDTSPESLWIPRIMLLFNSLKEKIPQPEPLASRLNGKVLPPNFVPLGFKLRRAYLLKNEGKQFYGFVYSDGLFSFILLQSVYPFQVSGSRMLRYFRLPQEGKETRIAGEKEGFYFFLIGGLDPRVGQEILKSLSEKGGR
ncbi:MAG: hypothetical protein ABDK87_00290 [Atribacterota bacterium]